jgi:hypothetical protein
VSSATGPAISEGPVPDQPIRKPLVPLPEEERVRQLAARGLGPDLFPLNRTPEEALADSISTRPDVAPAATATRSLVPGWLAALAHALIPAAAAGAHLLPVFIAQPVSIAVFILSFFAGLALPQPDFVADGHPLVPLAMVPILSTGAAALAQAAAATSGTLSFACTVGAMLCAWLAGVALPQPTHATG